MTTRGRFTLLAAVILLLGLVAPASTAIPPTGWAPNSLLVPPAPTVTSRPGFIHTTRRIVPQARIPGRFFLGHALYGLWQSVPGAGWTPLMPACLGLVAGAAGATPGCGVEGIAVDESAGANAALSAYVATYHIDLLGGGDVGYGGIWKAELARAGSTFVNSGGVVWRQLLPGVRGNAMLVKRTGSTNTLVVGRIQRNNTDVGTDANASCGPGCQPSVYVSQDDGRTWSAKTFTGSACAERVGTSSRLVGGLAWDRNNPNVIYAAANSGLWVSTDNGNTWGYAFFSCGSSPGFALTSRSAQQRIYVGQNTESLTTSSLFVAAKGAGGNGPWSQLTDEETFQHVRFDGWVQSIVLDARDASERTMYVATWRDPSPRGGGLGSVYKVIDRGNGLARVIRIESSVINGGAGPYPLSFGPWAPSLFLAQHPLVPDLIYASSVYGGVWTKSEGQAVL